MKRPQTPPAFDDLMRDVEAGRLPHLISEVDLSNYLHWDELRYRTPPGGLTHREWWLGIKLYRGALWKEIPLVDCSGISFRVLIIDPILEYLHQIDLGRPGFSGVLEQAISSEFSNIYFVDSLIEEAITSSQLEGATTTRQVAREMLRTGRVPQNRSEQMILNNYLTMNAIGELKDQPLTQDLIFHLHRMVTEDTLDDPSGTGRFRYAKESVHVADLVTGEVLHRPPPAEELPKRLQAMCDFANGKTPNWFIHPALRAIILHFWLGYDHPFVDGNGRTARALFYWSMLRNGYGLFKFLSISQILRKAPVKYSRSFLYTETDDNDLTYFILYQLRVIEQTVDVFHQYVKRKARLFEGIDQVLKNSAVFNHRQRALLSHALRHPRHRYTIYGHQNSHNVVYQTARTDLLNLQAHGLLNAIKAGKQWVFTPVENLSQKLTML